MKAPDLYEPARPEVSIEIDPPRDQVLGRMRTDATGRPLPPDGRAPVTPPAAPAIPRPPATSGARTLPGVPPSGAVASAPLTPGAVQAAPLDAPSGAVKASLPPAGGAKALLKRARDSFLARRYGLAEASYKAFLGQYGHDPKAPQAQFELGETYYVQGRYKDAGKAYLKTYKSWPKSSVAPQALLRLGMSLNRLGMRKKACAVWKQLRQRHPGSRAARSGAPREMKRARCRG
jgi:tol-pal system protein YbgF